MTKPELELGFEVIRYTFEKLPAQDRIRVVEELERQTRRQRWSQITAKIRNRAVKYKISQREIDAVCKEARQEFYAKRNKSGN